MVSGYRRCVSILYSKHCSQFSPCLCSSPGSWTFGAWACVRWRQDCYHGGPSLKTLPFAHEAIFLVPILMPWQQAYCCQVGPRNCSKAAFPGMMNGCVRQVPVAAAKNFGRWMCTRKAPRRSSSTGLQTITAIPSSQDGVCYYPVLYFRCLYHPSSHYHYSCCLTGLRMLGFC